MVCGPEELQPVRQLVTTSGRFRLRGDTEACMDGQCLASIPADPSRQSLQRDYPKLAVLNAQTKA